MSSNVSKTLGFGCASVFRLPTARHRRAVLDHAYELGIRHFDVAPIYGLGRAETELADFRDAHADIVVATKFGIRPTAVAVVAGRLQAPVRVALRTFSSAQVRVQRSANGPQAGGLGHLLYSRNEYSVKSARDSLDRSERSLRTAHIDYFLLHEPFRGAIESIADLVGLLDSKCSDGRLGAWGSAGTIVSDGLEELYASARVLQHPYSVEGAALPQLSSGQKRIVFGFLSSTLGRVRSSFAGDAELRNDLRERAGWPINESDIPDILLRDALHAAGKGGLVLISSTNPAHLEQLVKASSTDPTDNEDLVNIIRARVFGLSQ